MFSERWSPAIGGGEIHIEHVARELVKRGHYIVLITRSLKDAKGRTFHQYESKYAGRLEVHRVFPPSDFENVLGRSAFLFLSVAKSIRIDGSFDLIHCHGATSGIPGLLASRKMKIPVVLTVHGFWLGKWVDLVSSRIKATIWEKLERIILFQNYGMIVTVDKAFISVARRHGYSMEKIRYIPNGVDIEEFCNIGGKFEKSRSVTFLFVGRLERQKGIQYLIEAVNYLKRDHENFEVLIVGEGKENKMLNEMIGKFGLSERIKLLGRMRRSELVRLYLSSDVFVCPSIWEGMPLTILEAWSAELPIIVTDVGGLRDVCLDGVNAIMVPPKNPKALATAMLTLLDDEKLRNKLGSNGKRLVKSFTWEKVTDSLLKVYEEVINNFPSAKKRCLWANSG